MISSEIFSQRPENESLYLDLSESELKSCGANFDPTIEENKTTLKKPELEKVTKKCTFMRITSPYLKINLSWLKRATFTRKIAFGVFKLLYTCSCFLPLTGFSTLLNITTRYAFLFVLFYILYSVSNVYKFLVDIQCNSNVLKFPTLNCRFFPVFYNMNNTMWN